MTRPIALTISMILMSASFLSAQDADDAMIKEFQKFVEGKGGQNQLMRDPEYAASVGRRKHLQGLVQEGIALQEKALAGTKSEIEKAVTLFASRAQTRGTAIDHYLYGRILGQTRVLDEAYREFKEALVLDRYLPWAWDGLGVYHSNKGNWAEAIEKFKRVLQLWPGHVKATFGLAQCYFRLERYSDGLGYLRAILNRPEVVQDPAVLRQTRLLIAEALRNQGKFADAIDVLTQVLKVNANDSRVLTARAWCSKRLGRLDDAARDYEALLVIKPGERRFYEQLFDIRRSQGRNADAIKVLERLLEDGVGDLTAAQITPYQDAIERLRKLPAHENPKKRRLRFDDYIKNLANSPHVEKRREAIKVLASAPPLPANDSRRRIVRKALAGALKDRDCAIKCIALEQINRRFGDERVLNVTMLLGSIEHEKDSRVRGMANHILQDYPGKMVTPALIMAMKTEPDLYVFRQIHESLNAATLAWIERVLPNDLEIVDMVRIRKKWMAWYRRNRDLYRKYEPKDFKL